jgi:hypothetical protein
MPKKGAEFENFYEDILKNLKIEFIPDPNGKNEIVKYFKKEKNIQEDIDFLAFDEETSTLFIIQTKDYSKSSKSKINLKKLINNFENWSKLCRFPFHFKFKNKEKKKANNLRIIFATRGIPEARKLAQKYNDPKRLIKIWFDELNDYYYELSKILKSYAKYTILKDINIPLPPVTPKTRNKVAIKAI